LVSNEAHYIKQPFTYSTKIVGDSFFTFQPDVYMKTRSQNTLPV
jgi:hypothetical protein